MELEQLISTGESLRGLPTDSPQVTLWEEDATMFVLEHFGERYRALFQHAISPRVIPFGEEESRQVFAEAHEKGIEFLRQLQSRSSRNKSSPSGPQNPKTSPISNALKQKLEHIFDMAGGYVLDFTNSTFADFISTSLGFDPYDRYSGSKASILRQMWADLEPEAFRKLTLEMLERWQTNKLMAGQSLTDAEQKLFDDTVSAVKGVANESPTPADTSFLEKDFSKVDLAKINVALSEREVVEQRLDEIERCMRAEAPLAVIFLCGSTLEGLLNDFASKNPKAYNVATGAPKHKGVVKPLSDWTLENLIVVSREVGIIGEDVVKHAHAVKDFRNYIHPRQQLKENFKPRMFTAQMAHQVLMAALADLSRTNSTP